MPPREIDVEDLLALSGAPSVTSNTTSVSTVPEPVLPITSTASKTAVQAENESAAAHKAWDNFWNFVFKTNSGRLILGLLSIIVILLFYIYNSVNSAKDEKISGIEKNVSQLSNKIDESDKKRNAEYSDLTHRIDGLYTAKSPELTAANIKKH